jgi:hypothetical protein
MDVVQMLASIFAHHRVVAFRYFEAIPKGPIQDDIAIDSRQRELIAGALRIRKSTGIPFIEAVMLRMLATAPEPRLLIAVSRHFAYPLRLHRIRAERPINALRHVLANRDPQKMLVLSSKVTLASGVTRHLPMLDFRFAASSRNQKLITAVLSALDASPGYLLTSGGSYHFYGRNLLTTTRMRQFLSRTLFYNPIVDKAWVAHQLFQDYCGLRISPRSPQGAPRVIVRL